VVDCTFTVRPKVGTKRYREIYGETIHRNPVYSEYIKEHAWKLNIITAHKHGDGKM